MYENKKYQPYLEIPISNYPKDEAVKRFVGVSSYNLDSVNKQFVMAIEVRYEKDGENITDIPQPINQLLVADNSMTIYLRNAEGNLIPFDKTDPKTELVNTGEISEMWIKDNPNEKYLSDNTLITNPEWECWSPETKYVFKEQAIPKDDWFKRMKGFDYVMMLRQMKVDQDTMFAFFIKLNDSYKFFDNF